MSQSASSEPQSFLTVEAAGRSWGVPLEKVERVARLEEAQLDLEGPRPTIVTEDSPQPVNLLTLDAWGAQAVDSVLRPGQRLLWLRHEEKLLPLLVDGLQASGTVQATPDPLPRLPFASRPPVAGLAGEGEGALCLVDIARLEALSGDTPAADRLEPPPTLAARPTDEPSVQPTLAVLPELPAEDGGDVVIPVMTGSQLLGIERATSALRLPGLPDWCLGIGWRQGKPIAVFDVRRRLLAAPPEVATPGRWVIAALPGGGAVALALEGSCRSEPLPEEALAVPAKSPLGSAIHGLFQVEGRRLALLDLERWQSMAS